MRKRFQIKIDKNNNVIAKLISDEKRDGYFEIDKELFNKINLLAKIETDNKNKILSYENFKNIEMQKRNDISNKKKGLENSLNESNQKLVECFEHFLNKIVNITNISDLLKFNDYPYNLSELLKERSKIRKQINKLELEIEEKSAEEE